MDILQNKVLYFGYEENCFCYKVQDGKLLRYTINELKSEYIEADTPIQQHIPYQQ